MGNMQEENNILKKTLSNGTSAILRTLFNSNLLRVSIVNWLWNLNFITRTYVSDIPKSYQIQHFSHLRVCQKRTSQDKIEILRPLYNQQFC